MRTVTKSFRNGEIIYRQGEESRWAFEILEGVVELIAEESDGASNSLVKAGDLFGDSGVLDNSPRAATARARGPVTVRAIPRDEFLRELEANPATALKVMTKMAKRLKGDGNVTGVDPVRAAAYRDAAAKLPVPVVTPESLSPAPVRVGRPMPTNLIGERKPTIIEKLIDAVVKDPKRRPGRKSKAPAPSDILILVGRLKDDYDDLQRQHILEALDGIPGVRAEVIDRDLTRFIPGLDAPNGMANDDALKRATREARAWMAEQNADLLIWGGAEPTGRNMELRFVATASSPGERPGRFTPMNMMVVPNDFYDEWVPLLRAVVLAAVDPRSFPQGRILRSALPSIATTAKPMGVDPSPALEPLEQAAVLFCYGNVAAICAQLEGARAWYHVAVEAWQKAAAILDSTRSPILGQLHQQLGLALQIIAERTNDPDRLQDAADSYRRALIYISRRKQPVDWGLMKYRLACVLYKVDMAIGDDNALREAVHASQAARKVFNPYTHPIRWSEISNTLAQILQVYGDNIRSVPILEYAVKCCAASLQVRTPDTAPLQWASIQNTLGSALFLLAKHTGEWEYMRQSSEAFRLALSVYRDHGAGKLAIVTERNLTRAERQMEASSAKHLADPVWAQSFNIADTGDDFDWAGFLNGSVSDDSADNSGYSQVA